ncbi:MAG: DUF664 domain-containing protein [Austwickia sp.]|nr:DUF664 domain-containing protein [Austwickia sp.]
MAGRLVYPEAFWATDTVGLRDPLLAEFEASSVAPVSGPDPIWEPPLAGTEAQALLGALDRLRYTFRWKADGLDAPALATTVGASTMTLAGLLKHLAAVEDFTTGWKLSGEPLGEPWSGWGWDGSTDWDFTSATGDAPELLYATYDDAVRRGRARLAAALANGGLEQRVHVGDGAATLRRLVCDLIEEYGRHTGHADLLREAVDGRVGEDPPPDWSPPF